ncbi:ABC transporter permease [Nonomuraea antimicrobica]
MSTTMIEPVHETVRAAERVAAARRHVSVGETLAQTLTMAWRALMKMRRNPEQFFDVALQPILFTAMFAYIFGGAVTGDVNSYLPLIIPGILAQTVLTTCMATGTQLREDMEKGCSTGSSRCRSPGSRRSPGRWWPTCCVTRSRRR